MRHDCFLLSTVVFGWYIRCFHRQSGMYIVSWAQFRLGLGSAENAMLLYVGCCYDRCAVGRYSNANGATECLSCGIGQYQNLPGKSKCEDCLLGTFSNSLTQSD